MPESFTESVEASVKAAAKKATKKAVTKWNPESNKYFERRGMELKNKYPLRIPKPPIPDNPTEKQPDVVQEDSYAHEAWVWHPEEKDWIKHQASFDRDTDMLLKGMAHKTIQNTLDGEENISEIFIGSDGHYYREFLEK